MLRDLLWHSPPKLCRSIKNFKYMLNHLQNLCNWKCAHVGSIKFKASFQWCISDHIHDLFYNEEENTEHCQETHFLVRYINTIVAVPSHIFVCYVLCYWSSTSYRLKGCIWFTIPFLVQTKQGLCDRLPSSNSNINLNLIINSVEVISFHDVCLLVFYWAQFLCPFAPRTIK